MSSSSSAVFFQSDKLSLSDCSCLRADECISIRKQGLKLESRKDCADLCSKIASFPRRLRAVVLEGNSIGPEAAKYIGDSICEHRNEIERLILNDIFTGRSKDELPDALSNLLAGLHGCPGLVELNLSDNAFGPIGMDRLTKFIASCKRLKVLRLHNNGLGIEGATKLASALKILSSSTSSCSFQLTTLICGRNRLENRGATAIAHALMHTDSLQELQMPQNGICGDGICELVRMLKHQTMLKLLNLNDNTFNKKAAIALATILPDLRELEVLNIGDCLLRDAGLKVLCPSFSTLAKLEVLNISSNEIGTKSLKILLKLLKSRKRPLSLLRIECNEFEEKDVQPLIREKYRFGSVARKIIYKEEEEESEEERSYDEPPSTFDKAIFSLIQTRYDSSQKRMNLTDKLDCLFELSVLLHTGLKREVLALLDKKIPSVISPISKVDDVIDTFKHVLGFYHRSSCKETNLRMTSWRLELFKWLMDRPYLAKNRNLIESRIAACLPIF